MRSGIIACERLTFLSGSYPNVYIASHVIPGIYAFMNEEWAKWIEAPTHHVTPAGRVTAFNFQYLRVGEKFLAAS